MASCKSAAEVSAAGSVNTSHLLKDQLFPESIMQDKGRNQAELLLSLLVLPIVLVLHLHGHLQIGRRIASRLFSHPAEQVWLIRAPSGAAGRKCAQC